MSASVGGTTNGAVVVVSMTREFLSEWTMSEVVDNLYGYEDDVRRILDLPDDEAEAAWQELFGSIHDWDRDRVEFDLCILTAHKTKATAKVTFTPRAVAYVRHYLGLNYQLSKWHEWGREGAGFLRSGRRILKELGGVDPETIRPFR